MNLLLVDDDEDLRTILAEMLEDEGFCVAQAASGREALMRLDAGPVDLILLDFMMPEMSGAEFLKALHTRPDISGIPVVLLTAASSILELAAIVPDAILNKPFQVSELLRCIAEVAARRN